MSQVFSTVLQTIEERKASCLYQHKKMVHITRLRWLVFSLIIFVLLLGFVGFFFIRATSQGKSSHLHPNGTSTPFAPTPATPATPPTLIKSSTPTPAYVAPYPLQLSSDPYTNGTSQHGTEVEPGSYAYGSTIVAAFQAGRFLDHGSSNIGWATSTDGGATWQHGFLPGTTVFAGGSYGRITDPSVAYDAAHQTWLIATVAFLNAPGIFASAVLVSRSTNGGTVWSQPIAVADVGSSGGLDKDWITCDTTPGSPFFGNCYLEWDNYNRNSILQMSTSNDGGKIWSSARTTVDRSSGFSGYPLVQPDGTVIIPMSNASQTAIMVVTSTDGGASWSDPRTITAVTSFPPNAYLRDNVLLTDGIDAAGTIYLIWVDCRFESGCAGNDLVMATSTDGHSWSPIRRIPIAPVASGINYYVAALGVDQDTAGSAAHLGLAFYSYAAHCFSNCKLSIDFVSSPDGGATWSAKMRLASPFPSDWAAAGQNKIGDYISVSFSGGKAFPVFALARAPSSGHLNEAMYTMAGGLTVEVS